MVDGFEELKKKVFDANMKLSGSGLIISTFGNVSGIDRNAQIIAIKPSGIEYSQLKYDDMVLVSLSGEKIEGNIRKESLYTGPNFFIFIG